MTLGNHEFNFGKDVFTSVLGQATFPLLQANVTDDGHMDWLPQISSPMWKRSRRYRCCHSWHRQPPHPQLRTAEQYPRFDLLRPDCQGTTTFDPLRPTNDVVIALTHIGFTENPASVEVDANVDTNLVATYRPGCRHRRAQPYQPCIRLWQPTSTCHSSSPMRMASRLLLPRPTATTTPWAKSVIGLRAQAGGNYEVVSQTGPYIKSALADR